MRANIHIHTIYLLIYLRVYTYITARTHKYVQTFILTYIITPWTRDLLVKLIVSQLVKKFPVFYGNESSLLLLQELASCPYPEPPSDFIMIYLNIILPPTPGSSKWSLSPQVSSPKSCMKLSSVRATFPAHLILLDLFGRIIFIDDHKSLSFFLLCSLLHSQGTSSFLGPNILLSTLFSNTISPRSSLSVNDQVSHPYKTTGQIIVLYI